MGIGIIPAIVVLFIIFSILYQVTRAGDVQKIEYKQGYNDAMSMYYNGASSKEIENEMGPKKVMRSREYFNGFNSGLTTIKKRECNVNCRIQNGNQKEQAIVPN